MESKKLYIIRIYASYSGIGQMLVQAVEQAAQERGCHSVMLFSSTGRSDAHRFYEKLGFLKDAAYGFVKPL
ncbi:GNAT family N-acetyltransferase [Paenibacillus dendritiformis]|uniref:GNAT family N-acetyltransferase n=1 Tax=Paenibacillus dendritiformis TaxID=130049 RepID=UPI00365B9F83